MSGHGAHRQLVAMQAVPRAWLVELAVHLYHFCKQSDQYMAITLKQRKKKSSTGRKAAERRCMRGLQCFWRKLKVMWL